MEHSQVKWRQRWSLGASNDQTAPLAGPSKTDGLLCRSNAPEFERNLSHASGDISRSGRRNGGRVYRRRDAEQTGRFCCGRRGAQRARENPPDEHKGRRSGRLAARRQQTTARSNCDPASFHGPIDSPVRYRRAHGATQRPGTRRIGVRRAIQSRSLIRFRVPSAQIGNGRCSSVYSSTRRA